MSILRSNPFDRLRHRASQEDALSMEEKCKRGLSILYTGTYTLRDVLEWHNAHSAEQKYKTGVVMARQKQQSAYCLRLSSMFMDDPVETQLVYCLDVDIALREELAKNDGAMVID